MPDSLGIGFGLVIPTGDLDRGTGDGRWVASPSVGWVVKLGKGFVLLPRCVNDSSFNEEARARDLDQLALELGVVYVKLHDWWIQYLPALVRDSDLEQIEFGQLLTTGKQFTRRISVSLDLVQVPDLDLAGGANRVSGARFRATLKLKWVVGF